ncbi:MAG: hypothetical protein VB859_19525, partial [Planctomycetaceae bacterium]
LSFWLSLTPDHLTPKRTRRQPAGSSSKRSHVARWRSPHGQGSGNAIVAAYQRDGGMAKRCTGDHAALPHKTTPGGVARTWWVERRD